MKATVKAIKPTQGWNANSYIVFDYQSQTNFKFAGLDVSTNKLVMGHRGTNGWVVDKQAAFQMSLKSDTWYNLLLSVNGLTATLIVKNTTSFSFTYAPTVVDGWSYGLNWGLVGFGSNNARGAMDDIAVQIVSPAATVVRSDDFATGIGPMFTPSLAGSTSGTWQASAGRYAGAPTAPSDTAIHLMNFAGVTQSATSSLLDMNTVLRTSGRAGFLFDRYSDADFKFAAIDVGTQQVMIGHRIGNHWVIDAAATNATLNSTTDYTLGVVVRGSTVGVTLNGQAALGFAFNAVSVDGRFGLFAKGTSASFDSVTLKTDDPAVNAAVAAGNLLARASAVPSVIQSSAITPMTRDAIAPVLAEAKQRWAVSGRVDAAALARLDRIDVQIVDFGGALLGQQDGDTIFIDRDAAGWGWFVDATPGADEEYLRLSEGVLSAKPNGEASGRMDLLTALGHEIGHVLGYPHTSTTGLMDASLSAGEREVMGGAEVHYFDEGAGGQFVRAGKPDKRADCDPWLYVPSSGYDGSRTGWYVMEEANDLNGMSLAELSAVKGKKAAPRIVWGQSR